MNPLRCLALSCLALISLIVFGLSSCGSPVKEINEEATSQTSLSPTETVEEPFETPSTEASEDLSDPSQPEETAVVTCENAVTQTELNECAHQEYETADAEQNQLYQKTLEQLSPSAKAALTAAELAWHEFKDLDCKFARSQYAGGSIEPLLYYDCLAARSRTRLAELSSTPSEPSLDANTADAELNQRYQTLLTLLTSETAEEITTVQLSWIDYRDHNCDFEANHTDISPEQCLARMSQTRTAELDTIIEARSM